MVIVSYAIIPISKTTVDEFNVIAPPTKPCRQILGTKGIVKKQNKLANNCNCIWIKC